MGILLKTTHFLQKRLDIHANKGWTLELLNAFPFWIGAAITGVIAVVYAQLFRFAEEGTAALFRTNKWLLFISTPLCFVVAWWLVKKFSPYSRGSGIPQVSAAVDLANPKQYYKVEKLLSVRVVVVKILSSLVMVFGGGGVGREGPTIQIAGSVFKKINDWLPAWYPKVSKRNMLVTGAAAGLAAAFNTPLGGIVFAIEELTETHFNYFKSALLTGVIIAGLTALSILGPYLYLGYPQISQVSAWIVFPVLLVSLIAGYSGGGMGKIILLVLHKKNKLKGNGQHIMYLIICGLVIAAMGVFVSYQAFGSGKDIMQDTLFSADKYVEWYVPIIRFVSPVISFSTGAAGGVFAPALSAGAAIGSAIAHWFQLNAADANLLILCGMAAFLTGITRSPFTSSILVLEMTDANNIIFYLMIAGLVSNIVSKMVDKHSFYEHLKVQYLRDIDHEEALAQDGKQPQQAPVLDD